MKIQRKGGAKAPVKVTPAAPAVATREPYFERMQEFERSMMRRFFEPWGVEFEAAPFKMHEMHETERAFIVSAVMPGFKESEIEVRAEPWRLYLHAQHEETAEEGKPVFEEHREFARWVEFPAEVNPEKTKAVLSKGMLEVTLQKAETAKKVEVRNKAA